MIMQDIHHYFKVHHEYIIYKYIKIRETKTLLFIQRPPGLIQRDAIQLCKGQRQFGYKQATKCIEVAQNRKYWSYFNLK